MDTHGYLLFFILHFEGAFTESTQFFDHKLCLWVRRPYMPGWFIFWPLAFNRRIYFLTHINMWQYKHSFLPTYFTYILLKLISIISHGGRHINNRCKIHSCSCFAQIGTPKWVIFTFRNGLYPSLNWFTHFIAWTTVQHSCCLLHAQISFSLNIPSGESMYFFNGHSLVRRWKYNWIHHINFTPRTSVKDHTVSCPVQCEIVVVRTTQLSGRNYAQLSWTHIFRPVARIIDAGPETLIRNFNTNYELFELCGVQIIDPSRVRSNRVDIKFRWKLKVKYHEVHARELEDD